MQLLKHSNNYWLTRSLYVRGLGLLYFVVGWIIVNQGVALVGTDGLLPISEFMPRVFKYYGHDFGGFLKLPSLYWFTQENWFILTLGWTAIIGSIPLLLGRANFPLLFLLWWIQLSTQNSGQLFWSYGWESQLCEMTFLAFFMCPLWNWRLDNPKSPPSVIVIWSIRWCLFRLMLGAGLIKLRGDQCWRDLTCTVYHYETQPNPHPLSLFYHHLPTWFHMLEVAFNHFVEVVVPFFLFGPTKLRRIAAILTTLLMLIIISSGNLSWLNWATLVICIGAFDDEFFAKFLNPIGRIRWESLKEKTFSLTKIQKFVSISFCVIVVYLSWGPAINLFSKRQRMNTSYNSFHLINSYGAFGAVGKKRYEIVISGMGEDGKWREYEFKCKPGDPMRRPCLITPYHYRLDWQIWFSAMRPHLQEGWLQKFAYKLLEGDQKTLDLIDHNPFPKKPPQQVKMDLYLYQFADVFEEGWWKRVYVKPYMKPLSLTRR